MAKEPPLDLESLLKDVRDQFLKDVDAEQIASEARHKDIISEKHETRIKKAESVKEANEILFDHLLQQATQSSLEDLCKIMISANGYAKMKEFGQELLGKVKPSSCQVSSATPSDMEAEDKPKLQHETKRSYRKRPPSQDDSDPKRSKDSSDLTSHCLLDTDAIDGELRRCLEVNIGLLKSNDVKPEEVIQLLYNNMCQCIANALDKQLDSIKYQVVVHCKQKRGPFRSVSEIDAIEFSPSAFAIMDELGILDRWLNTTLLRFFITLSRPGSAQRRIADYWLQQYTKVLRSFCSGFLVTNLSDLPDEHQDQLRRGDLDNQGHQGMLCVVYEHEFTTFTLADLLKEIDFLKEILQIPPGVIKYLQTLPSNSVAVYWLFDMSYAALIFFDVHQLFWPLLEHRVLSLELKNVMTVSLRGSHVPYLIRNALQSGQNLVQQTEVFTRQFHALVGLGVSEHSFENADTVRRRTVCRKFVQSVTTKESIAARTRQVLLDQQEVSEALLKGISEKKPPLKESQEYRSDRRAGHPEDEQHPSVPPLEVPLPFAEAVDVPTAPTELLKQQLLQPSDPPPASKEDEWQDPAVKYAPKEQRPKKKKRRELERKEIRERLSALPIKHTPRKVTAERFPLSQEALSAALKKPVSLTLQPTVEAVKYLPVAHKHKEHFAPTKRPIYSVAGVSEPVVFSQAEGFAAEVSELAHYETDDKGFVDDPYPGQEGDFDDEAPDTLPEKGIDKSKGHAATIKAECFALICGQCLEQLSDKMRMRPLGTCRKEGHIKKMIVQPKGASGVNMPVRSCRLPSGQDCKMKPCPYYPDCFKGDMCQLAHGEEELDYWKAMYTEQMELCLDCRCQAVEQLLQQCQLKGHKTSNVVYCDAKSRELVRVHWPVNASKLPLNEMFTVTEEHLNTCHDQTECSSPHHYLEGRILNLWRENNVVTSTRPSPTWFLAELQRAATMYKKIGPLPKEVLSERDECLSQPITRTNYIEKLLLLTEWEQHTHMEALEKYNGIHEFVAKKLGDMDRRQYHRDQPSGERDDGYCVCLFMPDLIADHLRQAASWVSMKFQNGDILEGTIQRLPKRFESKSCLAVKIDESSGRGKHSESQRIPELLIHSAKYQRVDVIFTLKHSYFTSLRNALRLLPPDIVDKLVPDEKTLKTRRLTETAADVDYPVLDQFDLDDEYQEPACRKVLNSTAAAPFLITGPFGAGKTRVLATLALRLLLHNSKCFILIATHHVKTADQYIEKYFAPFLEIKNFQMKKRLKVVRVIGGNAFFDSGNRYMEVVSSMKSATVDKCNLIITTFGTMLRLQHVLKSHHRPPFTHIFIDEGAQAREPETLGAFCHAGPDTKIVIAGDHKQVGPQTSVLGPKARDNGFTVSLVARLHELYWHEDLKKVADPYQAVMLTNYRSHPFILCLPNSLFYDCSLQAYSKSQIHPDYRNSLYFVCTSLDDFSPDSNWHKDEVYNKQVWKEVKAAGEWVEKFIDDENWPEVEWGPKDLSMLCVVVPNRYMERVWRYYARRYDRHHGIESDGEGLGAVTCNVAYGIQGREFRALFICTSEAVDENCATRDPVKSLCDQYVFNTVITRSCSLIVAIGNPFRLMKIEALGERGDSVTVEWSAIKTKKCWQMFICRCLQCKSLLLTEKLMSEQRQALSNLEDVMFSEARKGLKELYRTPANLGDSILQAYNDCFAERCQELALASNTAEDALEWTLKESDPLPQEHSGGVEYKHTNVYRLLQKDVNLCTAVPVESSHKKSYHIVGVQNRRCAFDGALVEIEVMNEESRHAKVVAVKEQGSVQPKICVVNWYNPTVFFPVDKSPRLVNLPYIPKELLKSVSSGEKLCREFKQAQKQTAPYVICFDPLHLKHGTVPRISHIIPKEVAQHLLFVVCPIQWVRDEWYPFGAVVGVLPKGSSELYACKILSIMHHVPDCGSDDSETGHVPKLHGLHLPPEKHLDAIYTDAIGIVSRGGHSSLALSVSEIEGSCVVSIHICNAAYLVSNSDEFHKYQFSHWTAIFGHYQGKPAYHSVLPQSADQDLVQALEFTTESARESITLRVKVSATEDSQTEMDHASKQVPRFLDLEKESYSFEKSTVQCQLMLDLPTLEELIADMLLGKKHGEHSEELQGKPKSLELFDVLSVLYAVANQLCLDRQGHIGYPELQQVQHAILYPEAWKMIHELVTYANMKAAERIGHVNLSEMPLQTQYPPLAEDIEGIFDWSFYLNLSHFEIPYFRWLSERRHRKQQAQSVICTRSHFRELIQALERTDVIAVKKHLMQPHRYPQLSVLEATIEDALPKEEYVVKRISRKRVKADVSVTELLEKVGGKHHSLQAVVAPYTSPFDSIFDIYVQYMLTRAIQDFPESSTQTQQDQDGQEEDSQRAQKLDHLLQFSSLSKLARICTFALADARSYEASVNSVDLAVYAQHSSICAEAFIKGVENETIHLCYPAPGLQGVVSVQTIKTRLVTKSDKASSAVYTAKVTCIDGSCVKRDLKYTRAAQGKEGGGVSMVVFYHEEDHLGKYSIVPEYEHPTVKLSYESILLATEFLRNSSGDTAHQLLRMLNKDWQQQFGDIARESIHAPEPEQGPSDNLIQEAPFFNLNTPFLLEPGKVVKVWLRTDVNEYVLTPKPQLLELNQDVRICLEHNSDIQACFTQCAFAEPSTLQYSSRKIYFRIWEELVRAEAATNSVGSKEQLIFKKFQLELEDFQLSSESISSDYYCPGDVWAILPRRFLANRQDIFPVEQGSFACIRFDVELNEENEEDFALLEKHKHCLYPDATDNHIRTVMHMVVEHVTKVEDKEDEEEVMISEERVINADLKVKFKVVGHHNARVSPLMKDVLEKKKPHCEMQLFPMFLPSKRVYQTLRRIERMLPENSLGEDVILGRVDRLVGCKGLSKYQKSGSGHKKLLKLLRHPNVLYHQGDGGRTPLNDEQITALMLSLRHKFQLIHGPPGTGKSITGAHIAYAFVLLNQMNAAAELATAREFMGSAIEDDKTGQPHLKCVLYCGPSNVSVDVVLGHLHHLNSAKSLRILRMYGKVIENLDYAGPYYDSHLFVKRDKYDIDENLKRQYALHEKVHLRDEIKEQDKKFAELHRKGLTPTAEERFQYRELIRQAEEDVIKKGQFDIVLCTCNETSGHRFRRNIAPIQCIIDEAGMATEPEAVVALSQAEQVVLIGDHMQLQPVVMNRTAGDNGLRVSLFERYANLLKREFPEGCPNFQQLLKQYRMVESICDFPSNEFYDGKLDTVCKHNEVIPAAFWPQQTGPIAFIDIVGKEENAEEEDIKTSKRNEKEAWTVVDFVKALDKLTHSKASIAVITPYKAQKKLIEGKLNMKANWRVQTVDASQGSEADYVVLSMVRSKPLKQIKDKTAVHADRKWRAENLGIVADTHHLCVALTRARFGLVIIGNKTLLSYNGTWNELIQYYTECRYVVDEHWIKRAMEKAKLVAQKQPPHPPSKMQEPLRLGDDKIEEMFLETGMASEQFDKERSQKQPQMLQEKRRQLMLDVV